MCHAAIFVVGDVGVKSKRSFSLITENLFGTYYEKGDLIAKTDTASVEEQDDPLTNANRYVLADITSFFTLLVGIYFPSVTGKNTFGLG